MIGIKFLLKQETPTKLKDVLSCIENDNYEWYVTGEVIGDMDDYGDDIMTDKALRALAEDDKLLYTYWIDATAYRFTAKKEALRIFGEYERSDCILQLYIHDVMIVHVYCKDEKKLEQIAAGLSLMDVEYFERMTEPDVTLPLSRP